MEYLKRKRVFSVWRLSLLPSRVGKICVTLLMIMIYLYVSTPARHHINRYTHTEKHFKTILDGEPVVRHEPKILLYTNFFGSMNWYEEAKTNVYQECPEQTCSLTDDKSQLADVDAVVYHLNDIISIRAPSIIKNGFQFPFPKYRHPDQVWVFYNIEPLTSLWMPGYMTAWQGIFNWTWSYTQNSEVFAPYGDYMALDSTKVIANRNNEMLIKADYFGSKPEQGAVVMNSHCIDEARRYRIIDKLKKFIPVRTLGGCYEGCPDGFSSCEPLLDKYQFYLAFENSDCEDYISEKYWRTLERGQIPIVAWKLYHDDIVIPGSYINVNDFPDLDAAGRYIQQVSRNKTLYNSFFEWRFTAEIAYRNGFCELCKKLRDARVPRMVYHDMNGWIKNQTCKPFTVSHIFQ